MTLKSLLDKWKYTHMHKKQGWNKELYKLNKTEKKTDSFKEQPL